MSLKCWSLGGVTSGPGRQVIGSGNRALVGVLGWDGAVHWVWCILQGMCLFHCCHCLRYNL